MRYSVDLLMNLGFIMILQWLIITYMNEDQKLNMNAPSIIILNYLYTIKDLEQIN